MVCCKCMEYLLDWRYNVCAATDNLYEEDVYSICIVTYRKIYYVSCISYVMPVSKRRRTVVRFEIF